MKLIQTGLMVLSFSLAIPAKAIGSSVVFIEVADTIMTVEHALDGLKRANAINESNLKSVAILTAIGGVPNYPGSLEYDYLSYMKNGDAKIKAFYKDKNIPSNMYIHDIEPYGEMSKAARGFEYIFTDLDEGTCKAIVDKVKPSVKYLYVNPGDAITTLEKGKTDCDAHKKNTIVALN